ncbi:hypothetical protein OG422_14545 [Streptomyces sp. NBC_01525]|nr:hypothetical protein [Streptomyces benahoarensis]
MPAALLEDFDLDIQDLFEGEADDATAAKAESSGSTLCCTHWGC